MQYLCFRVLRTRKNQTSSSSSSTPSHAVVVANSGDRRTRRKRAFCISTCASGLVLSFYFHIPTSIRPNNAFILHHLRVSIVCILKRLLRRAVTISNGHSSEQNDHWSMETVDSAAYKMQLSISSIDVLVGMRECITANRH